MRSLFDEPTRRELMARFDRLAPDTPRRWGTMGAAAMITHLTDQMTHTLGDVSCPRRRSVLAVPGLKQAVLYWLPWPGGRVRGPDEAFVTRPVSWDADLERFRGLVERFAAREPRGAWPDHALFGRMTGRAWGIFCYRHFDHHLRQFGV